MHIVESHWVRAERVLLSIEYSRALSSPQTHSHGRIRQYYALQNSAIYCLLSNALVLRVHVPAARQYSTIYNTLIVYWPLQDLLPPLPIGIESIYQDFLDFLGRLRSSTTTISRQEAQLFETIVTFECCFFVEIVTSPALSKCNVEELRSPGKSGVQNRRT